VVDAFYDPKSATLFQATAATVGPWDPSLQHGGPPAALLGRALERQEGPPGSRIARFALDFFGPVPVAEVSVETEIVRPGTRIQLASATLRAKGRVVLRATAWRLSTDADRSPAAPPSFVVPPMPDHEAEARFDGLPRFGYGDALEWRFVEGGFLTPGPATVWTRSRIPLVRGDSLTGLQRTLVMVDAANGISAILPLATWTFVPVDLMVSVLRLPDAEWVGMSSRMSLNGDGIGMTDTVLFDERGAFGRALQTLYVAPR
jgi:hypothetical protein